MSIKETDTDTKNLFYWLPPYTIRVSNKSRKVRLQICPTKGLELIVPKQFNLKNTSSILLTHKTWIEKKLVTFAVAD